MPNKIDINIAQLNFTVGDIASNTAKILEEYKFAKTKGADIVVFPELAICGYPPEDLVLHSSFYIKAQKAIEDIAAKTDENTAILIGGIHSNKGKLYNAAFLLLEGKIKDIAYKKHLPNYGVFDEKRLFSRAKEVSVIECKGVRLGILICEDMWYKKEAKTLKQMGAKILICINASPFEKDKAQIRTNIAKKLVRDSGLPFIYLNLVGGQDELVFDGASFVINSDGKLVARLKEWEEKNETLHFIKNETSHNYECRKAKLADIPAYENLLYEALKLGLKDYVEKNGFPGVVIGMSGGIDSALTAAIAKDALGKDKVKLIMMPAQYTSEQSIKDAKQCANLLELKIDEIPIMPAVTTYEQMLKEQFKGKKPDVTEENIQSRIRGNILMAISNKTGFMLLTTGNKSEMAVGYATLYGDMCGGFNVLKDIYKTQIYELARWRNSISYVIPESIIDKLPTAELRENQTDQDTLPPYDILDDVLYKLIELRQSSGEIIKQGFDKHTVKKVAKMVKLAEYKRRQAPPGVKVTALAFGRDRRYPITSSFDL